MSGGTCKAEIPNVSEKSKRRFTLSDDRLVIYNAKHVDAANAMGNFTGSLRPLAMRKTRDSRLQAHGGYYEREKIGPAFRAYPEKVWHRSFTGCQFGDPT